MITLFTVAKAFKDHINVIQRNALKSWLSACPGAEVILFGDDDGVQEICGEFGIRHGGGLERSEFGRSLVSDAFARVKLLARFDILCYLNCDIIVFDEFLASVKTVSTLGLPRFLLSARRRVVDVDGPLQFDRPEDRNRMRAQFCKSSKLDRYSAIDCLCFPKAWQPSMPSFAVGEVAWDNWMITTALVHGVKVIDVTADCMLVHQNHEPAIPSHLSPDRLRNLRLAGPVGDLATLLDADALLISGTLRNPTGGRLYLQYLFRLAPVRFLIRLKRTGYHSIRSVIGTLLRSRMFVRH
jgi:hypothetical protein